MTPLHPRHPERDSDLDPLDELASAHLDGLTSEAEEARIANDPELRARVAAMQRVRAALHEPVPVDHEARERRISAALAAFDEDHHPAPVSDLAAAAARRSSQRRAVRVLGIAAAVVLLVIAVPLLAGLGDDDSDADMAATSDQSVEQSLDSEESAALDSAGGEAESSAGADAPAEAPAAQDRDAGDDDGAVDPQRPYSSEPSPASGSVARRLGLLEQVGSLSERVAALLLDALRRLGTTGDP